MTCQQCHRPAPSDAKFCPECGARLSLSCPACGADNAPGGKFCKACGQPLVGAMTAAPLPAPQSYTPAHLAQRILHARPSLEGERKQVTVLFADLKGSMELLADRDPEEARSVLDPVLERMMEAVHHGLALYVRERHASQMFTYGGHDPGVCCRYQLGLDLWLTGWPDRAAAALGDAHRLATELRHPLTETNTLWFSSWVAYQRGDREAAIRAAERLQAVAGEHGFTPWTDGPIVLLPALRGARVDRELVAELHREIVARRSTIWRHLLCLCVLAELCLRAGLPDEGLARLAAISETDRETMFAPEVRRLEGELLLQRSPSEADAAEQRFRHALALARERGEKSLELRAAMSLGRLLAAGGDAPGVRALVGPVYEWFTEGFATADLIAAKALLADLGR